MFPPPNISIFLPGIYHVPVPRSAQPSSSTKPVFVLTHLQSVPELYFNHLWPSQPPLNPQTIIHIPQITAFSFAGYFRSQYPELLNQTPSTKLVFVSTHLESVPDLYFNHLWPSQAPSEPPNHHTYPPDISIFLQRKLIFVWYVAATQPTSFPTTFIKYRSRD